MREIGVVDATGTGRTLGDRDQIPGAEHVVVEGAGHCPQVTHSADVLPRFARGPA
ncbi:hypothetical protein [Acrocarpospora phusangensis]|uniref:hypothetical protein n=1 Tax=Acrocarpospora phusangensis TaxID=1070424 RepID=UPI00194F1E46|nr:hypothetical protein [Acrocarpospora phusangensis]